jgi:hypothetical protein
MQAAFIFHGQQDAGLYGRRVSGGETGEKAVFDLVGG